MATESEPLDVWLRIPEGEEESDAEANTFKDEYGWYRVEWYLTSVGLVSNVEFRTYAEAEAWLTAEGFRDFTV